MASLFPHFESRIAELGKLFDRLDALGKEGSPGDSTKPEDVQPLAFDESVFEKLGSTRKGLAFSAVKLFEEQTAHCRELLMLAGFLLHGGPMPELKPSASKKALSVIKPEQYAYMSQMFVIFWVATLCWILLNPPGLESIAFLELTIVLGLIGIMTGEDKPLRQVLIFALGIGCTGLAYTFIYPLVSNLGEFIVMMGVRDFSSHSRFRARNRISPNRPSMLPWLSIGNFTNLPTYDFRAAAGWLLYAAVRHFHRFPGPLRAVHAQYGSPVSPEAKGLFPLVGSVAAPFAGLPRAAARLPVPAEDVFPSAPDALFG